MAELVESGDDVVPGQQRGAAVRLGEVEAVDDHGLVTGQVPLVDQAVHPSPTLLAGTGVVIGHEQAEHRGLGACLPLGLAQGRGITDLPHAHIRVIHMPREVCSLVEGDAVQTVGSVEDTVFHHIAQLEVRSEDGVVDSEALLALGLLVARPVSRTEALPWHRRRIGGHTCGVDIGVPAGVGHGRRDEPCKHVAHRLRGPGGRLRRDDGGVVLEAQQLRPLSAQGHLAQDERARVRLP